MTSTYFELHIAIALTLLVGRLEGYKVCKLKVMLQQSTKILCCRPLGTSLTWSTLWRNIYVSLIVQLLFVEASLSCLRATRL